MRDYYKRFRAAGLTAEQSHLAARILNRFGYPGHYIDFDFLLERIGPMTGNELNVARNQLANYPGA